MTLLQRTDLRAGRKAALALITLVVFVLPAAAVTRLAFHAGIRPAVAAAPAAAAQPAPAPSQTETSQPESQPAGIAEGATQPAPPQASQSSGQQSAENTAQNDELRAKVRARTEGNATAAWIDGYLLAQIERERRAEEGRGGEQQKVEPTVEEREHAAEEKEMVERRARQEREAFEAMTPEQREALVKERQKLFAQRRAELLKQAKLTMQQAMDIALRDQPGVVVSCNLVRERDTAMYVAEIVSGNEDDPKTTRLLIDAGSGQIVNKSDMLPRVRMRQ